MLGGSLYVALIRLIVNFAGVSLLYFLLSEPRFGRKRTAVAYVLFDAVLIAVAAVWYVLDWESYVRLVSFTAYVLFAVFAAFMSGEHVFLLVYKLALIFYFMAVFMVVGIETSILFFDNSVWVDIITRIVLIALLVLFVDRKLKSSIRGFGRYMENELDSFSITVMIISILSGIGFILNPNFRDQTPYRLYQILMNFFLTGAVQLLVWRLYLHIGREQEYRRESQLTKLNHRLLERQMELLEESAESGKRIRHDARHHNAVIAEYARKGETEELLQYLNEYEKEMEIPAAEVICANSAVNNLLSAYTRKARKEQINVTLDVELERNPGIPNIDLVAILANAYENAIYGCVEAKKQSAERACYINLRIRKKKNKLVISCSNTCRPGTEIINGQPKPEVTGGIGVLSIIKTAEHYEGEYDFKNDDGVFVFRLIMNIPQMEDTALRKSGGVRHRKIYTD